MSHSGWSASNYISAVAGAFPTAVPFTIHALYKPTTVSGNYVIAEIYFSSSQRFLFYQSGTSIAALQTPGGQASGATLTADVWQSVCARFGAADSRQAFINGTQVGTNTTSGTPTTPTNVRIGLLDNGTLPASGSLAEVAIWNASLTDDEIASLVYTSALLIRPASLVCYIPLLGSGTLDLVAPAATVTGTLTKDNDHPRVILPRQRSLIIPKSAGGGGEEQAVGSSAGSATAAATGQSTARASSTVAGTSTVAATGRSTAAAVGNAAGSSTAAATGTYTGEVQAVGTAAGTSSASAVGASTGGTTTDTHDGFGYGDPFRRKRRPKKGKREKAVEDLLKKLMGLVPDDPPPAIEAEAEIAQASVERLFAPTVDVTPNLEALQFAQLQLAKLEAMLNRYLEDEEDDDDLLLMAA